MCCFSHPLSKIIPSLQPPSPPPQIYKRKKPKPTPKPPEPQIPSPDMGDLDIFPSNKTPEWARDAESVPEELEQPIMDNDDFWALYDDPF